ncbi:hypothetical protein [Chitinilyticum litopenaei]|uniref:hypothetical protein n=1 Tax=Chitinilyticum litopenaei TaxID=1121276 RepID=UPI000684E664|nr:hypothetical protein [Chitinilyticum litopenaei]
MIISIQQFELLNTRCDVVVASRSLNNLPSVCWGMGGLVHDDRKTVSVWLHRDHSGQLIADIRDTSRISAVFSVPFTNVSFQLKGENATVRLARTDDALILQRHCGNMVRELELVQFGELFARTVFEYPLQDLMAVDFTISAMFEQTPGPRAGQPLGQHQ